MTDLKDLIERLEKAEGPDREIDGDLFETVDPDFPRGVVMRMSGLKPAMYATGAFTSVEAQRYTASMDAALALVERKLPGWAHTLQTWPASTHMPDKYVNEDTPRKPPSATVRLEACGPDGWRDGSMPRVDADAKTLPLALCLALLRALSQDPAMLQASEEKQR